MAAVCLSEAIVLGADSRYKRVNPSVYALLYMLEMEGGINRH